MRYLMQFQVGTKFVMNTSALKGQWKNENGEYYDANYVIHGPTTDGIGDVAWGTSPDDGTDFSFPSVSFLDRRTRVCWNPVPKHVVSMWKKELRTIKHTNSMERAKVFAREFLTRFVCRPDDVIVLLDGNGESRQGMHDEMRRLGLPSKEWPRLITFEKDADVALANKMMFGDESVIFTGSDPSFKSKSLMGSSVGVLLEHLTIKKNNVYTDETKRCTKAAYFDYCGGPVGNLSPAKCKANFSAVLESLPNLKMFAITISYRRHALLKDGGVEEYVDVPDGFELVRTFLKNKKVLCQLFAKTNDPVAGRKRKRML